MFKRLRFRLPLLLFLLLAAIGTAGVALAKAPPKVGTLILGTTVTGGAASLEATAATNAGLGPVTVVDGPTWDSMTTAQFASYRELILGDPTCVTNDSPLAPAVANASTWGPAVKGRQIIIGTDPVFHATFGNNSAGAMALINQGIKYAAVDLDRTGIYLDLSCYYTNSAPGTPVPVMAALSSTPTTVQGCFDDPLSTCNNPHIVHHQSSGPLGVLTDANLAGWGQSIHEEFNTFPAIYVAFAVDNDSGGLPYILIRDI